MVNIAILEEDTVVGDMLQHGLELAGYNVAIYYHPAPFFAALVAPAPAPLDCIIVDLPLTGGMSGEEVVQEVRNLFPAMPAILIVEGSSWESEGTSRDMPGIGVLRKPFKLKKLLSLLKQLTN